MPAEKDYTRLGLFLVIAGVVVLATAMFFVQRYRERPSFAMVTYTEQTVTGLNITSPVRFKGVLVGQADIDGGLIGGAALDAASFVEIIKAAR